VEQWHPPLNGANRFAHVDALRAFAVALVVAAHAGLADVIPGGSGVTIFFAISGFIITHTVLRELGRTSRFSSSQFYLRRAIKIVPPFLVIVIVPTIIYGMRYFIQAGAVLTQVFFVYNWIAYKPHDVFPGTNVVWSLAIEEQFYIVFALLFVVALRVGHWRGIVMWSAVLAVVVSTIERVILAADPANTSRIFYGTDTRLDSIAWGVLAAFAYDAWTRGAIRPRTVSFLSRDWTLVIAVAVYIGTLVLRDEWFRDTFRYSFQALAACALVLYGLVPGDGPLRGWFYKVSANRAVSLVGLASYSIYLVHNEVGIWLNTILGDLPRSIRIAIVFATGIVLGIVIYWVIEIPAQRIGRRLRKREPTSAPSADRAVRPVTITPTVG
jgi:peptidoglycan/LPS O-acetylase OafA/YrhL